MISDFVQRLCLRFMAVSDYSIVRDIVIGEVATPEAGGTQLEMTSRTSTPRSSVEPKTPQEEGQLCVTSGTSSSGLCNF
jgi:hypothetical protein